MQQMWSAIGCHSPLKEWTSYFILVKNSFGGPAYLNLVEDDHW